jgi:hypothetical protein
MNYTRTRWRLGCLPTAAVTIFACLVACPRPRQEEQSAASSSADEAARGDREMKFLARPGAKPFGFTNPVWIE